MAALFVLDVPEFGPIVQHCQGDASFTVAGPHQGYWRISRPGDITLTRRALGFKHALWYSCLTGGLLGQVARFDHEAVVIAELPAGTTAATSSAETAL